MKGELIPNDKNIKQDEYSQTIEAGLSKICHLRSGDTCPRCQTGKMEYDGLLNLTCIQCGYIIGGGFT
jgi:uncharacterized protein (DUF983 family)